MILLQTPFLTVIVADKVNKEGCPKFCQACKTSVSEKKLDLNKLTKNPTCIIIGPEGDFSEAEREQIFSFKSVQPIRINENILRSETAVISAISIINYCLDL